MFYSNTSFGREQLNSFGQMTWKSFTGLHKKAMEQEFTWSGFIISLSIAFFIVSLTGASLASLCASLEPLRQEAKNNTSKIYILEKNSKNFVYNEVSC